MRRNLLTFVGLGIAVCLTTIHGDDESAATVSEPAPNRADEPFADTFSLEAGARFLDQASLHWTKTRKCFTCHTNYAYLTARPAVSSEGPEHQAVRSALEDLVETRWQESGPRWDAEVVMSAAVLALNDAATTGKLHPTTRVALDRMWTVQRDDGGIDWLKCGWPPMESDDEFGGRHDRAGRRCGPDDYRRTEAATAGMAKLRKYLREHAPPTLHHRAMLLWADSYLGDLLSESDRKQTVEALLELQKRDGGWNLATLGDWTRSDDKEQDTASSDGYATGFVIYVLRRAGVPRNNPQLRRGVDWLKTHQRVSGRWYTRSLNKDNKHFISHAGSAFALMAIAACDEP